MKLNTILFSVFIILFSSCGNEESIDSELTSEKESSSNVIETLVFETEKFEGGWVPDMSSLDIHLSEYLPQDVYAFVEEFKYDALNDQAELDAEFVFEMMPDGILKFGEIGEVSEYQWSIKGEYFHVNGILDEEPLVGKPFNVSFKIIELNDAAFSVKVESKHLLDEVENQFSSELKDEMAALPLVKMFLNDSILNQTWATLEFKKK